MEHLLKYCESDRQREIVYACMKHTTKREAADKVGLPEMTMTKKGTSTPKKGTK